MDCERFSLEIEVNVNYVEINEFQSHLPLVNNITGRYGVFFKKKVKSFLNIYTFTLNHLSVVQKQQYFD